MESERYRALSVEEARNAIIRPVGLAGRLRENLTCLLIVAAPIVIPVSMVLTGHFFKMPQLIDWGFKGGMGEIAVAANLLLFARCSQQGD